MAAITQRVHACAFGQASAALLERSARGATRAGAEQALSELQAWLAGSDVEPGWPGLAAPVHDMTRLNTSMYRSEPSVKDVLFGLRDTEGRIYSFMNAIATQSNPDLDRVRMAERSVQQEAADQRSNALVAMSEFRRVRESTTARSGPRRTTPGNAVGYSRQDQDWTIREMGGVSRPSTTGRDWVRLITC